MLLFITMTTALPDFCFYTLLFQILLDIFEVYALSENLGIPTIQGMRIILFM